MKKFFALLAVVLAVVSCQKDVDVDVNLSGDLATISVVLPEDAITRANWNGNDSAQGGLANTSGEVVRVIMHIYDDQGRVSDKRYVDYLAEGETTVAFDVRLVPNRQYTFVAWADMVDGEADVDKYFETEDLRAVTMIAGSWDAMKEERDAFTATYTTPKDKPYTSSSNISLTLTRPFAKLRVVTTDMEFLNDLDVQPKTAKVSYATKHYNAFNAVAGVAINKENTGVEHEYDIASYGEDWRKGADMTLFTDYFFAADGQEEVNFSLEVFDQNNRSIKYNNFNTPIPVKRNNLTTIAGNILTEGNNVTVTVDPVFAGKQEWPSKEAEELAAAAMFGGEVTLTKNVVLNQPLDVKSNMTLNLGGKTLEGVINVVEGAKLTVNNGKIVNVDKSTSGITSNGDLTLNDVNIVSARHAVRIESGNVVINGGTYKVVPVSKSTLHALNVGDDNTVANVTIKGGKFIGPKGTEADSGSALNVRSGSTVTIEGGDFSGGKTKTLSVANQGALTVKGGTFDQNPTNYVAPGYKAIAADGVYYVLPKTIANAAEAEGVTSVTESTADVATALATVNGKATLFMWNDVAYIAKYGKVVITSAADEATTVRAVVESSTGLTSATVADGIEVVGNRTFRKCANLETVALPNTLTEIGPAVFQSCSKLANITIPESVTTIGEGAFAECTALTSINIPAGITRLEKDVLRNTGLVSVEIPASVNYIGTYAFRDCKQLKEVYINAPEFTIEPNAFGVMSGTLPGTTIYVANAKMKEYLEKTLSNKNQFTIVAPNEASNADQLADALANGEYVVLSSDLTISSNEGITAPYGNKTALSQNGGVFDGNGKTITADLPGDNYIYMTNGGTTKNLNVTGAFRGIMIMSANQTVRLENVVSGGTGVVYALNTGEGDSTQDLVATNCTFNGWSSWSLLKSATFTNCIFGQGSEYSNVYGRLGKPYVNTVFDGCDFCGKYYIDLSAFVGTKVTFKNCTVNDVKITAENWASLVAPEDTCGEGQISVELKDGSYLTAENVADYIVFE